jgi:serpin B8
MKNVICTILAISFSGFAISEQVADNNSRIAIEIYKKLADSKQSIVVCPFSVLSLMAEVYVGARGNSATQISSALFPNCNRDSLNSYYFSMLSLFKSINQKGFVSITSASGFWFQNGNTILPNYSRTLKDIYSVTPVTLDLLSDKSQTCSIVNDWIFKNTQGKFTSVIDSAQIDDLTKMILANTVYFKGKWKKAFNKQATGPIAFYTTPNETTTVEVMRQEQEIDYYTNDDFSAIRLPFKDKHLSLIVFLPAKVDGLKEFENNLSLLNLRKWESSLKKEEILVVLPKLSIKSKFSLNPLFISQGITDLFDPSLSDLSGITGKRDSLHISKIDHLANILSGVST